MNKSAKQKASDLMQELAVQSQINYEKVARKMRIAAEIADAMESLGLSKKQLADRMNQKPSVVTKWLSGTHNFTIDTLTEIATVLGVEFSGVERVKGEYNIEDNSYSVLSNSIVIPTSDTPRIVEPITNNKQSTLVLPFQPIEKFVRYGYC